MIRAALRGLRGRLLLSLVATSAVTLAVAAAITLGPLQSRLRDESETALQDDDRGRARRTSRTALTKTASAEKSRRARTRRLRRAGRERAGASAATR